ncbi:MAG: hypothetical protein J0L82_15215 [Deltaproteobacteria bacterium]|jgi:hypothetical protein|nr:hypothetical protein [Deltaproteobacteria bacterium]
MFEQTELTLAEKIEFKRFGRAFFMSLFVVAIVLSFSNQASAATCKVRLEELKTTIVGKGSTAELAFEDAATQCFEKKASRARRPSQNSVDEELGLAIIDQCANVRCES